MDFDGQGFLYKCRHKPTLVFTTPDGIQIYGASKTYVDVVSVRNMDLVVCCTKYSALNDSYITGSEKWSRLNQFFAEEGQPEEVIIDWPDMGVIPAGRRFWEAFYETIREGGYKKVLFYCFGGHGRTGTAIASLMTIANGIHGGAAIRIVRHDYCKEAIETKKQEAYVRSLTTRAGDSRNNDDEREKTNGEERD